MEKNYYDRFFEAINYLLESKIVKSKSELALVFSISRSKFSEILNRRMNPGLELFILLITNFNIHSDWLMSGIGPMFKEHAPYQKDPPESFVADGAVCAMCQIKDQLIISQKQTIDLLNEKIHNCGCNDCGCDDEKSKKNHKKAC